MSTTDDTEPPDRDPSPPPPSTSTATSIAPPSSSTLPIPAPSAAPAPAHTPSTLLTTVRSSSPTLDTLLENPSPQLQVIISLFDHLQTQDYDTAASLMADDFTMQVIPQSLGTRVRTKEDWLGICKRSSLIEPGSFRLDFHDINESPGKIWVHCTGSARTKIGDGYENEMIMMFRMTDPSSEPDGKPKVLEMREFMDSLYITSYATAQGQKVANMSSRGYPHLHLPAVARSPSPPFPRSALPARSRRPRPRPRDSPAFPTPCPAHSLPSFAVLASLHTGPSPVSSLFVGF
ncbi:hypothetical protein K474DRAFT_1773320 [Panus rudis PR-1116 ss-1]|nr:hypothetical protein K474DRAFT_1773320 [Panus rudis PR-1116 ss-1]